MNLTNLLLLLILSVLSTYVFTPWKNMQKPPTKIIFFQFLFMAAWSRADNIFIRYKLNIFI